MPAPPETDLAKIRKYGQAQIPAPLRDQLGIEATVRVDPVLREIGSDPTGIFWG